MIDNNELYHFGVKGMKWGVRKKRQESSNKDYTKRRRFKDDFLYGPGASKRISRSMNKGMTYKKALGREKKKSAAMAAAYGAALLANPISRTILKTGLNQAVKNYAHSPVYLKYLKLRYGKGFNFGSPAQEALKEIGNKIIVEGKLV